MRITGEKFKYELVTDYILTRNPSRGEVRKEFNLSKYAVNDFVRALQNPIVEKHLKGILDRNSYRDLKGYKIYQYMIFNPKEDLKTIMNKFGIKTKTNFVSIMDYLVKVKPSLNNEIQALIKKVC